MGNGKEFAGDDKTRRDLNTLIDRVAALEAMLGASPADVDADTLDGQHGAYYAPAADLTAHTGDTDRHIECWACINQENVQSLLDSYNVAGITDDATGKTTITIATDFASANYAITSMASGDGVVNFQSKAAGSVAVWCRSGGSWTDVIVCVMMVGDRA